MQENSVLDDFIRLLDTTRWVPPYLRDPLLAEYVRELGISLMQARSFEQAANTRAAHQRDLKNAAREQRDNNWELFRKARQEVTSLRSVPLSVPKQWVDAVSAVFHAALAEVEDRVHVCDRDNLAAKVHHLPLEIQALMKLPTSYSADEINCKPVDTEPKQ